MYLSNDYESEREGGVSRYLGWTVWGLSVGTNLWATSLIFIRMWHVSLHPSYLTPSVMTRYILQAAQADRTIFAWQEHCYIHNREGPFFHSRVWGTLSVYLGMFCFTCGQSCTLTDSRLSATVGDYDTIFY